MKIEINLNSPTIHLQSDPNCNDLLKINLDNIKLLNEIKEKPG